MLSVNILIQGQQDPPIDSNKLSITADPENGQLKDVIILEKGMTSGRMSVTMHIKLDNGQSVMCNTSALLMSQIASAIKGAEERFNLT